VNWKSCPNESEKTIRGCKSFKSRGKFCVPESGDRNLARIKEVSAPAGRMSLSSKMWVRSERRVISGRHFGNPVQTPFGQWLRNKKRKKRKKRKPTGATMTRISLTAVISRPSNMHSVSATQASTQIRTTLTPLFLRKLQWKTTHSSRQAKRLACLTRKSKPKERGSDTDGRGRSNTPYTRTITSSIAINTTRSFSSKKETKTMYMVEWAGHDSRGDHFADTYVPKDYVNQLAVDDWKRMQRERKPRGLI
jgi:hypothetical protein